MEKKPEVVPADSPDANEIIYQRLRARPIDQLTEKEQEILDRLELRRGNDDARKRDQANESEVDKAARWDRSITAMRLESEEDGDRQIRLTRYLAAVHRLGTYAGQPREMTFVLEAVPCRHSRDHRIVSALGRGMIHNAAGKEFYLFTLRAPFLKHRAEHGIGKGSSAESLNAHLQNRIATAQSGIRYDGAAFDAATEQAFLLGDKSIGWNGALTPHGVGQDLWRERRDFCNQLTVCDPGQLTRNITLRELHDRNICRLVEALADRDALVTVDPFTAPDKTDEIMEQIYGGQ